MKKFFTFGIFLSLLLGIGNNVEAATFTSRLSGITNVPTATNHGSGLFRIGLWTARATWYDMTGVTDSTALTLPTYNDDVTISAGDSINLTAGSYCKNLTVSGTVCMLNGSMTVNGDLTVNSTGIFSMKSNAYCTNIYNYGKVWTYSTNGTGSPKSLYIGYTYTGTSTAGTGDYTILNDGIFGWYRTPSLTSNVMGSGFYVIYSNLCKSLTIQHSDGVTSGYAFTVASLYPDTKTPVNQDLTLNIKESIALIKTSSQPTFTLTNGDVFSGYNRTCTIFPNDTVFVAGGFHVKGGSSQPGANVGNMTYNVYGCLDVATLHPGSTYNEFNLGATSFASSTSSLTFNLGDGTLANAGTLVLGRTVKLVRTTSNQPITFNPTAYSTVTFGYSVAAPTITLTTAGVADNTLFPNSFYNLAVNNTGGVILPTLSNINVSNALTLTSGKITLGTTNLTTGSISGGSATSYVVTNGTGTLSQTASTLGTLFPIGTATGYAPATITPAADGIIAANVTATTTGTFTNYGVNPDEWTLTPAAATTATLAFTPETATYTTSPVIFSGAGYAASTAATLSGSTFTASGISLAAAATPFATGGSTVTALESKTNDNLLIYSTNNSLVVKNAKVGELVTVYGVSGLKVTSSVVKGNNTTMTLLPGIYIVKAGSKVQKVSVQ